MGPFSGLIDRKVLIVIRSTPLLTINQRFPARSCVPYSTEAYLLLTQRGILVFRLRSQAAVILMLGRFWRTWRMFNVFNSRFALKTLWVVFQRHSSGWLVPPEAWTAWRWFINVVIRLYSSDWIFRSECGIVFLIFLCRIRFSFHECFNSGHNCSSGQQPLQQRVSGYIGIKAFRYVMSNVSPMTSFASRYNITCSKTIYISDLMLLWALWSDLLRTSSSDSSIMVYSSFVTKYFTAYLVSLVITSSSSGQQISVRRFWYSTFGSPLATAAILPDDSFSWRSSPHPMPISIHRR